MKNLIQIYTLLLEGFEAFYRHRNGSGICIYAVTILSSEKELTELLKDMRLHKPEKAKEFGYWWGKGEEGLQARLEFLKARLEETKTNYVGVSVYSGKGYISLSDLLDYQKDHANYMYSFASKRDNEVIIDFWVMADNTYEISILHLNRISHDNSFEDVYAGGDPIKAIEIYNKIN